MKKQKSQLPISGIQLSILFIRHQKIILDADLAQLYGVSTKALNQAVKRNKDRFPGDFMFLLSKKEKEKVVTNCDHLRHLKYSSSLPTAFTEHGAIMAASIVNSSSAIRASVQVVRAFVRLRELLASHKDMADKLESLERKYDAQFRTVFDALRQLIAPQIPPKRKIGFE